MAYLWLSEVEVISFKVTWILTGLVIDISFTYIQLCYSIFINRSSIQSVYQAFIYSFFQSLTRSIFNDYYSYRTSRLVLIWLLWRKHCRANPLGRSTKRWELIDGLIDWLTDWLIGWLVDWLVDLLIDWFYHSFIDH